MCNHLTRLETCSAAWEESLRSPDPAQLEEFVSFVDERLGLANIMYGAQRQANVLARPVIIPVELGGFEVLFQREKNVLGQTEVPRRLTPEMARLISRLEPKAAPKRGMKGGRLKKNAVGYSACASEAFSKPDSEDTVCWVDSWWPRNFKYW